jgi:hypothetical protein
MGSPRILDEADVRELLREECAKAGSPGKWAKQNQVPSGNLYNVLDGKRHVGVQIPTILGLKRVWIVDKDKSK